MGFLALSIEPDLAKVARGIALAKLKMPVATSDQETLAPLFVNQVPSTIFVDAQGIVVAAASGPRDAAFFRKRVEELLRR